MIRVNAHCTLHKAKNFKLIIKAKPNNPHLKGLQQNHSNLPQLPTEPLSAELFGPVGATCETDSEGTHGEAFPSLPAHLHQHFCHLGKCPLLQQPVSVFLVKKLNTEFKKEIVESYTV